MNQKFKQIIFFEDIRNAKRYVRSHRAYAGTFGPDTLVISMTPAVEAYCVKQGLRTQNTSAYFSGEAHEAALRQSDRLTRWLREKSSFCEFLPGIHKGYRDPFILFSRTALHYYLWIIEVVVRVMDAHRPQCVAAFASGGVVLPSLFVERRERVLGALVKAAAQSKSISFEDLNVHSRWGMRQLLFAWIVRAGTAVFSIARHVQLKGWVRSVSKEAAHRKRRPVLFTSRQYQMDKLMDDLKVKSPGALLTVLREPILTAHRLNRFILWLFLRRRTAKVLVQEKWFLDFAHRIESERNLFMHRRISFSVLLADKIRTGIAPHTLGLMIWSGYLSDVLDILNPCAVVSSGCRWDDVLIGELSKAKSFQSLLISHGSHVFPKNISERIEWGEHGRALMRAPFSHIALQSPASEGYRIAFPSDNEAVRTGPVLWGKPVHARNSQIVFDRLFGGRFRFGKVRVLVHAGTPKRNNGLRFYVYETMDEYIRDLRDLARAVEGMQDTVLIVRFRPSADVSTEDLKALVPFSGRVVLSTEGPFADALGLADLLVSFSSTTIEEALQNRIPVMLYGGGGRYQHIAAREIREGESLEPAPVYHVRDERTLPFAISEILRLKRTSDETHYRHLFDSHVYDSDSLTSIGDFLKL